MEVITVSFDGVPTYVFTRTMEVCIRLFDPFQCVK